MEETKDKDISQRYRTIGDNYKTSPQYHMLKQCMYECKGQKDYCPFYAEHKTVDWLGKTKETCVWYEIILRDLELLKQPKNDVCVTFRLLEKIIEEENNKK